MLVDRHLPVNHVYGSMSTGDGVGINYLKDRCGVHDCVRGYFYRFNRLCVDGHRVYTWRWKKGFCFNSCACETLLLLDKVLFNPHMLKKLYFRSIGLIIYHKCPYHFIINLTLVFNIFVNFITPL